MSQRPTAARLRPLLVALAVVAPAATALAVSDDPTPAVTPATSPTRIVSEQVGTARAIVPFGASHDDGRIVTFAVGQTRGPSPEPPVAPSTPKLARTTPVPQIPVMPPPIDEEDEDGEGGTREQDPGSTTPATSPVSVLLEGSTRAADAPTAWKRATPPLDADGQNLKPGRWRPAGATSSATELGAASQHAGESTARGAAALLTTVDPADGGPSFSAILVRTTDRAFRLLPAPPSTLLAPATQLSAPDAATDFAPMAAFDAPTPGGDPAPAYGRTGVLIAPPGGDGVLVWDGTAWSEEPFLDAAGTATTPARSASAIGATPDGDGVALVDTEAGTSVDRLTLLRRLADGAGWQPVEVDAPLLHGPLPDGVKAVKTVARPGDPLTVSPGHWWVDVTITNTDDVALAATVHLAPGAAPTTPGAGTTPPTGTGTDPSSPTPTSTTATSTPETTPPTTPPTTPAALRAKATRTWCQAASPVGPTTPALRDASICDSELPAEWSSGRGYRSIAFAGQGLLPDGTAPTTPSVSSPFGGRVITNPVVNPAAEPSLKDSSASGGYLRLDGDRFSLRGGIGETRTADNLTQSAAFISDRLGWTGGRRVLGHVTTATDADAATFAGTTPVSYESVIDVALSPGDVDDRGAVLLTASGLRRVYDDGRPADYGGSLYPIVSGTTPRTPRALAWPFSDTLVIVGTNGLLTTMPSPEPRRVFDEERYREPEIEQAAAGMDLTDVAFAEVDDFTDEAEEDFGGWAVGRDGAALHFEEEGIDRVELSGAFATADLREVVYAGGRAYVASSAGLLAEVKGGTDADPEYRLSPDLELQALMTDDGRAPNVFTVAGLSDGTLVVDGRYVRLGVNGRWERLPSPAEGDVVALGISRKPGATTPDGPTPSTTPPLSGLSIYASIADSPRPRRGEPASRDVSEADFRSGERPVLAGDGRLTELTPDGWIDRSRTPLDLDNQADVPVPQVPTQAITGDATGRGWAVSGIGGSFDEDYDSMIRVPRGSAVPLGSPRADGVTAVPTAVAGRAAAGSRAQTTPPSTSPTTPTTPIPDIAPAGPGSAPVRILVGGHPACLASCTGRADQRLAPTENLRQALSTAALLRRSTGGASVRALVVGGGRSSVAGPTFDRAAAQDYRELLSSQPGVPPVFPAIGTGDQAQEENRTSFANDVVRPLQPSEAQVADGIIPVTTPEPPGGRDAVAYAFDVVGTDGGAARIVIADTTDEITLNENGDQVRTPRNWSVGAHGDWLGAVLDDAAAKGRPSVVIGAAPIDQEATSAKADFLLQHGAYAYVSTDGSDDRYSLAFGPRERRRTLTKDGRELLFLHTSALGHALPQATINRNRDDINGRGPFDGPLADLSDASLLELTVPTERESLRRVVPRSVPVFRSFLTPESRPLAVGEAGTVFLPTVVDTDNGVRFSDGDNPLAQDVAAWGYGQGDATPFPCRAWLAADECGQQIDSSGQFDIADPSIAVFVRAQISKKDRNGPPQILTDANGNPIRDSSSAIVCPLKPGTTTATATVSGRSVTLPIRVVPRPESLPDPKGKCAFLWDSPTDREIAAPNPVQPTKKPVPVPGVVPPPTPQPLPKPTQSPQPPVDPVSASLVPIAPLFAVPMSAIQEPTPTIAPNPKPFTQPPPPSPPTGVNSNAWMQAPSPMMQFQVATALQEKRREQLARESAEHHATIYRAEPGSPLVPALAGGAALALLTGAAGYAAGRRRQLSRAAQRSWLR